MNKLSKINRHIIENRSVLLGVGPMSKECVELVIEKANDLNKPILVIASRRQIDSEEFNGGYVEKWTTHEFARFIREKDKKGNIVIGRDHGGPWQNNLEVENKLGLDDAMESSKRSFREDIKSGFDFIHIDPSIDIHTENLSEDDIFDRLIDLYSYCVKTAKDFDRDIIYEIGTEEQSENTELISNKYQLLDKLCEELNKRSLPRPNFVVMQTGTRVHSDRNIGSLDCYERTKGEIPAEITIPQIIKLCKMKDVFLKVHNLDYVSDDLLTWLPKLGVHSANVAPEFGVVQSKTVLDSLARFSMDEYRESLIEIAVCSGKWKKWYDVNEDLNDLKKAELAMHYCFSNPDYTDIINQASAELKVRNFDLFKEIRYSLSAALDRYLKPFKY